MSWRYDVLNLHGTCLVTKRLKNVWLFLFPSNETQTGGAQLQNYWHEQKRQLSVAVSVCLCQSVSQSVSLSVCLSVCLSLYIYIYMCTYICICCGVIVRSKFGLFNRYFLVQICKKTLFVKKHYKHRGSALFLKKKLRAKNLVAVIWSKLAFFWTPNLDHIITQIITIKKVIVLLFLHLTMCWNTYFIVLLNTNQTLPKKWPKKTMILHILQNTSSKTNVLLQPPLLTKIGVFQHVLKAETLMLNKKHNLKSGNAKTRKRDLKEKTRQETKKEKGLMKKLCNWIVWSCSFHEIKPKNNEKERDKNKEQKKAKK